ncbi:type III pantothenate kinase [Stutzerimonas tarimensis]|uniref:Type III pantothenate kinase n=1 Tax=Stutzerimonas tarimensis TaxID=1507735 RepID=A0ABV7T3I9_9GAMM
MILELDCGNSFIKWRCVNHSGDAGPIGVVKVLEDIEPAAAGDLVRARLVSVRGEAETAELIAAIEDRWNIHVSRARSVAKLGTVRNGYRHFEMLGADRWLAVVAAYEVAKRACMVVDLGTAVTVDLVDREGQHLGGYIAPGLSLMRDQLNRETRRVRYAPMKPNLQALMTPGVETGDAVERGCTLMMRAYVSAQITSARELLGSECQLLATGGDAPVVADLDGLVSMPDLVFRGLSIACP